MSNSTINGVPFRKGHGAGNDFILLAAILGGVNPSSQIVEQLCDRRKGIGADGVLRIAPASEFSVTDAKYFMDYRNADGSLGMTCGNGLRVTARFLVEQGYESAGSFTIGTRAGTVKAFVDPADLEFDNIAIDMGQFSAIDNSQISVTTETGSWQASGISTPNPHAVAIVNSIWDAGSLGDYPAVVPDKTFPEGVNVEFVEPKSPTHIAMRTHERGVGETLACGSGSCAAAQVWADKNELEPGWSVQVDLLGGTVYVDQDLTGALILRGPARIVASGNISPQLWQG
jgi:diaminopimelate epimerase